MKKLLLFWSFLFFLSAGFSQNLKRSPVGDKVQSLRESGESFQKVSLFDQKVMTPKRSSDLEKEVTNSVLLSPRLQDLQQIITAAPNNISLTLPSPSGKPIELELYKVKVTSPDFRIVTASQGEVKIDIEDAHYRGIIKGEHHSLVAVSIFNNEVMGMISGDNGTLVVGKLNGDNPENDHILYRENDLVDDLDFTCQTEDDGVGYTAEQLLPNTEKNATDCTNIYVEVGNDIFNGQGGTTQTANYITGLFNQVAILYNDLDGDGGTDNGIEIGVSEIFIWDVADPYSGSGSSANLNTFQGQHSSFNGDLGIFVNYAISGGVAAGFSGICNDDTNQSMCVAGINSSFSTVPTYSWSVFVCAHELGHLFGSRHTHACVWNFDNTAIDGCQRTEGNCPKPPVPADGGTIMSYCHLKNVGINFSKSFGDQPGNAIYTTIVNADCLGASCDNTNVVTVGNDPCSNGVQDPGEDGVDCGGTCTPCSTGSCDAPTIVNTTEITKRTATMNWSGSAGASSYDVDIRQVGGSWQTFNSTSTSLSLQGFINNRTYEWQVRANCPGATSANSSICTFTAGGASTQGCGGNLIAGFTEEEFAIYPNPATSLLQIAVNLPEMEEVQVNIIDMTGKTIRNIYFENSVSTQEVDVSLFVPGLYLIRIENGTKSYTKKVIIQ